MPKVGSKKYGYDAKGKAAAKKEAAKTGKPVEISNYQLPKRKKDK